MTTTPVTPSAPIEHGSFTYDPNISGPVKKRGCTDIICLFLFISFLSGWAVIAFFGFRYGDPNRLVYPTDSQGNICGINKLATKPHLYFFNILECAQPSVILKGCPTPQVCVSNCPNETFVVTASTPNIESLKDKLICKYDADMKLSVKELVDKGACASMYMKSKPLLGRCIPQDLLERGGAIIDTIRNDTVKTSSGEHVTKEVLSKALKFLAEFYNLRDLAEKIFRDIKVSWKYILAMLCFSMLTAFIWIVLMRFIAGIMVWVSLIAAVALTGFACYYSASKYMHMRKISKDNENFTFSLNLSSYADSKTTWLVIAIVSGIVLLILVLVTIFLRKRIRIAIALIREASKAVAVMPLTLVFPIFPYLVQLLNFGFWIAVSIYIASSSKTNFGIENADEKSNFTNDISCNKTEFTWFAKCMFKNYDSTNSLRAAHVYNFFGFLWNMFFWTGLSQVALAYAFSSYYWTFHKSRDTKCLAIMSGFCCAFRFHLGSIAFGSILLATMTLFRMALEYIDHKVKKYDNAVTRCIKCCAKCFFFCLEQFLKLITNNAYIMIAAFGQGFCASAKAAFDLLLRNVIRVVVLDKVTGFLFLLGKITIVSGTAVASFYVFSGKIETFKIDLHYYVFPIIIVTLSSFLITHVFFSVYGMAVDTIFLCFLQDLERNDGSPEKPYFMSKELMKILSKSNKFREPEK